MRTEAHAGLRINRSLPRKTRINRGQFVWTQWGHAGFRPVRRFSPDAHLPPARPCADRLWTPQFCSRQALTEHHDMARCRPACRECVRVPLPGRPCRAGWKRFRACVACGAGAPLGPIDAATLVWLRIECRRSRRLKQVEALRRAAPGAPILVLADQPDDEQALPFCSAGIRAYLQRPCDGRQSAPGRPGSPRRRALDRAGAHERAC
jgi:hypothetical protein